MIDKNRIPIFKKKVCSFITKEDGKISKQSLIKAGLLAAVISFGTLASAKKASAGVTCEGEVYNDCNNVDNPLNKYNVDRTETSHGNSLSLSTDTSGAVGTHNHCIQTCHVSHGHHSSHGSHGAAWGGW